MLGVYFRICLLITALLQCRVNVRSWSRHCCRNVSTQNSTWISNFKNGRHIIEIRVYSYALLASSVSGISSCLILATFARLVAIVSSFVCLAVCGLNVKWTRLSFSCSLQTGALRRLSSTAEAAAAAASVSLTTSPLCAPCCSCWWRRVATANECRRTSGWLADSYPAAKRKKNVQEIRDDNFYRGI